MKIQIFRTSFVSMMAAAIIVAGLSASDANAQRARRAKNYKKSSASRRVAPAAPPQIVETAPAYLDGNRIVTGDDLPTDQTAAAPTENAGDQTPPASAGADIEELSRRVAGLESSKKVSYDERQKRLKLNLDILTLAEQRAETLRKQRFELIERESQIKSKLENIDNDSRPEMIDRQVAFAGTLRPEELRDARKKNLDSEKRDLQTLLTEIQSTRSTLESNVQKADILVEKLRLKLEKDIDDALTDETKP